ARSGVPAVHRLGDKAIACGPECSVGRGRGPRLRGHGRGENPFPRGGQRIFEWVGTPAAHSMWTVFAPPFSGHIRQRSTTNTLFPPSFPSPPLIGSRDLPRYPLHRRVRLAATLDNRPRLTNSHPALPLTRTFVTPVTTPVRHPARKGPSRARSRSPRGAAPGSGDQPGHQRGRHRPPSATDQAHRHPRLFPFVRTQPDESLHRRT